LAVSIKHRHLLRVRLLARIWRQTSMPEISGSIRSSTTASGADLAPQLEPCRAGQRTARLIALALEVVLESGDEILLVFNH
jgi:hypothetical protein